jgi:AsmA protein
MLTLSGKQGGRALGGSAASPFSANLKTRTIEFPKLAAAFTLPNPGGGILSLDAHGKANLDIGKRLGSAALTGKFDDSRFDAAFGIDGFSRASYAFNLDIDSLDADRYFGKPADPAAGAKARQDPAARAADKPVDLSSLRGLNAAGSLRIGALGYDRFKASNVRIDLRAADGRLEANAIRANLYGGSLSGSASATASAAPDIVLHQNLVGIHLGPLLTDAFGKRPIDGRGNVRLDITAAGASFAQFKESLHGTAQLELHDGAVHGINVAHALREAKSRTGARIAAIRRGEELETGIAAAIEKTDFTELRASFVMAGGIARNDDLALTSPLLRVTGAGHVDLGAERLDYLTKATVVSGLQGQGGPELQSLRGITIPVRLSGPAGAIRWSIDIHSAAAELAKQKLEERTRELRSRAGKDIGSQKNKARERIGNELKGLLKN